MVGVLYMHLPARPSTHQEAASAAGGSQSIASELRGVVRKDVGMPTEGRSISPVVNRVEHVVPQMYIRRVHLRIALPPFPDKNVKAFKLLSLGHPIDTTHQLVKIKIEPRVKNPAGLHVQIFNAICQLEASLTLACTFAESSCNAMHS